MSIGLRETGVRNDIQEPSKGDLFIGRNLEVRKFIEEEGELGEHSVEVRKKVLVLFIKELFKDKQDNLSEAFKAINSMKPDQKIFLLEPVANQLEKIIQESQLEFIEKIMPQILHIKEGSSQRG